MAFGYLPMDWTRIREQGLKWAALGAAMSAGIIILYFFDPAASMAFPLCPFHALTGLHCPGCGTTRALHQLLQGRFVDALGLNPLTISSLPFIGYLLLTRALSQVRGRPWSPPFRVPYGGQVSLAIILLFWILRNIPIYPFSWLAP